MRVSLNRFIQIYFGCVVGSLLIPPSSAQLGYPKELRIELTSQWQGERFADGRPKVPDSILERMKYVTPEEAWSVLRSNGFNFQFEGGWKTLHVSKESRLVGRAVTAVFVPYRADLDEAIVRLAKKEGIWTPGLHNAWVINMLQPGDVLVVDLFGKIEDGTFIGDNLATAIFKKTGRGIVVDGAVRDLSGILEIEGFSLFVRDFHPTALRNVTLIGINVPVRIGKATVMPGDVVLGDPEGVTFIPAHLAEKVVEDSELTRLRDRWSKFMIQQGKYTAGQIDSKWTDEMWQEFRKWAEEQKKKGAIN